MSDESSIPVGISQCLLGDKVRYDGAHKRSPYCTDVLADFFEFKPVCPEAGAGLGIPRPPVRLVQQVDSQVIEVRGSKDADVDVTEPLMAFNEQVMPSLSHLRGYILMQKSPSCGMERVGVYHPNGNPWHYKGVGLFADKLMQTYPLLPVEEAGRLNDAGLRENFIARVYAYDRWKRMESNVTAKGLIDFYSDYKYMVMAHDPQAYHSIGRVLSNLPKDELQQRGEEFITLLMTTLKRPATRKTNTNVLMHLQGYFKKALERDQKAELKDLIEQYHQGDIPLVAPLVLIKHFLKLHPNDYLQRQAFLTPYPDKLRLRNSI